MSNGVTYHILSLSWQCISRNWIRIHNVSCSKYRKMCNVQYANSGDEAIKFQALEVSFLIEFLDPSHLVAIDCFWTRFSFSCCAFHFLSVAFWGVCVQSKHWLDDGWWCMHTVCTMHTLNTYCILTANRFSKFISNQFISDQG